MSTVENNWFHCVSSKDCDTKLIEGLVKIFKNHIDMLLETIMNLVDGNVCCIALILVIQSNINLTCSIYHCSCPWYVRFDINT